MKNISFGQYYPARSPIHALDARMKVVLSVIFIVCPFLCKNILAFVSLLAASLLFVAMSRIPMRIIFRSLRPLIFIMLFTAVLNLFFTKGETELWGFWKFHVYVDGIYSAVFMMVRILSLILTTSILLTYTTTPLALTDAVESLLSPLRLLHLENYVHEFAMMMTIALRFIPTLMEETYKIMNAQKARGVSFTEGSLAKRAKALVPILIPLFVSSFRRADELAMAMECRCYRGGNGRTKMHVPHLHAYDFLALLLLAGFAAGLIYLNRLGIGYTVA